MPDKSYSVAVVVGSDSDLPIIEACLETLKLLEIPHELRVLSAHRSPEAILEFAKGCEAGDVGVIVAGAGMAAHLGGVIAGHVQLPVIGVPMPGGAFNGEDALLATVQMPRGVPVATVAVGKSGAVNAAVLAAEIIALADEKVAERLRAFRKKQTEKVLEKDAGHRRKWPG
ncbi:MAG: 5-(carboxyamino)imidazole ribonucleotide mutase [Planctomycetota bacterium]|jgi:phosphoribosylaminoimidazole carboxylase PurE protein